MADIKSHQRVNDTLLGPLERPALKWLAVHQPIWVNPDVMTGTGILGAVVIFSGYIFCNYDRNFLWLASLGFFINWYGDSLDGTLARHRNIERPRYGYFVDHTVDSFDETLIILGLGLSPYLRFDIACLFLISYLLMSIMVFVRTTATGVFKISYIGLGPTEIRLIAVLLNTFIYFFGNPLIRLPFLTLSVYDLAAALLALLIFAVFMVETVRQARELARAEEVPLPQARPNRSNRGRKRKRQALRSSHGT